MNVYRELTKELEDSKCTQCNGRGEQDDMGIGDTYFNTWECEKFKNL